MALRFPSTRIPGYDLLGVAINLTEASLRALDIPVSSLHRIVTSVYPFTQEVMIMRFGRCYNGTFTKECARIIAIRPYEFTYCEFVHCTILQIAPISPTIKPMMNGAQITNAMQMGNSSLARRVIAILPLKRSTALPLANTQWRHGSCARSGMHARVALRGRVRVTLRPVAVV